MAWAPTLLMHPPTTWSTAPGSTPARRRTSICTGPRTSVGCAFDSEPPRLPMGERPASTMTTSRMLVSPWYSNAPRCRPHGRATAARRPSRAPPEATSRGRVEAQDLVPADGHDAPDRDRHVDDLGAGPYRPDPSSTTWGATWQPPLPNMRTVSKPSASNDPTASCRSPSTPMEA